MNQMRTVRFKKPALLFGLLSICFCPTCHRAPPGENNQPSASQAAATASAPAAAAPVPSAPESQLRSSCAGKYQGQYTVAPVKSNLTRKEGAPEKWESDDGQALAGNGELTLEVDPQNIITGSAKGALGQQTLRGSCDANTLRARFDATGDSTDQIQNAFLVADLTGDQASGSLSAATGNSLIRRTGTVTLRRAQ
jgi:hypothetical protein